ncbi:MAG: hypothetical protein KF753_25200 [Caldilineaceae bacterium]|nr:hypothetical protein [Caldilineaceae bacterium]
MKGFVLGVAVTLALLVATISFAKIDQRGLLQALLPQMVVQIEQDVPVTAYLQMPTQSGETLTVTLPLTLAVDLRIGIASPLSVTLDVGEGSDIAVVAELPAQPTPSPLEGVDRTDAAQMADLVLLFYRQMDLKGLAQISTFANQGIIASVAELGPSSSRYQSVFSGWRWEAVQFWDGKLREVRYRHFVGSGQDSYEAHVHFAEMTGSEIAVVVLKWENEQWAFEDINSPTQRAFEEGRTEFSLDKAPY